MVDIVVLEVGIKSRAEGRFVWVQMRPNIHQAKFVAKFLRRGCAVTSFIPVSENQRSLGDAFIKLLTPRTNKITPESAIKLNIPAGTLTALAVRAPARARA